MIETRRYDQTSRDKRFCPVCDSNQTEDEIHFLFHCPKYPTLRNVKYKVILQTLSKYPTRTVCDYVN